MPNNNIDNDNVDNVFVFLSNWLKSWVMNMVAHLLQNLKKSWENNFFFEKVCFLQNIHYLQKKFFYMEKKFLLKFFFTEKKLFYREKYKWKCKNIYISFEKYIFMQKMFVLQMKYKSFLDIYSFCKKKKN